MDAPMVSVVAPATLAQGYTFEAQLGGRTFTATVPPGGVKEGESFLCPLPPDNDDARINAPVGHWKDGLCDCLSLGCFHPHFCCALWCTQVAMGQVMQRMKLTWLGQQGTAEQASNTFKVVVVLVIAYTVYSTSMDYLSPDYVYGQAQQVPLFVSLMKTIGGILFLFWSIFALMNTRRYIRDRYQIPEERCHGFEDCCCAIWCSTCVVAQLARHTGEYEAYHGECCSATGLPAYAPEVV